MPVKLTPKSSAEADARIEIIPLIDIMFFLLASFMLVSLSMVNLQSVRVNLPTATTAAPETHRDLLSISVDKGGLILLDRRPVGPNELVARLLALKKSQPDIRVFISADQDARHGDVLRALDLVRSSGVDKVAFEVRPATAPNRE